MGRKVHFGWTVIHYFSETPEESAYRNKYWENFALDQLRFQERIQHMEDILSPLILKQVLDSPVYKKREQNNNHTSVSI